MVNGIVLVAVVVCEIAVFFEAFKKQIEVVFFRNQKFGYAAASHPEMQHNIITEQFQLRFAFKSIYKSKGRFCTPDQPWNLPEIVIKLLCTGIASAGNQGINPLHFILQLKITFCFREFLRKRTNEEAGQNSIPGRKFNSALVAGSKDR